MPRKAFTVIAKEINYGLSVTVLAKRLKEYILAHPDNVSEWAGVGVFKNSFQDVRYIVRDGFIFKIPSRRVVTMSEPRRKRTERTPITATNEVTIQVSYPHPDDAGFTYSVRNGAVHGNPTPHPSFGQPRNMTFNKVSSNQYEFEFNAYHNPSGGPLITDWLSLRYRLLATRRRSGWRVDQAELPLSDIALISPFKLTPTGGDIHPPFGPVQYSFLEHGQLPDLGPHYTGFATAIFAVHQGGL